VCGVVAIFAATGGLCAADVDRGVVALRHRGPDGVGTWASGCGRAALGHTRLAVIDLDTGDQPMHTADGRLHLVANGEFYDYERIRDELGRSGRRLLTRSDSEIALHLYDRDGIGAMQSLRGEFAFVLWDSRRGELFAARDRFGIKPLFYARHAGRLYLASEVKALLALGVPARWDSESLGHHLLAGIRPDRTLFAGINQVPPGCFLLADGHGVRVHEYWDLDYPHAAAFEEGHDRRSHREAVRDAVRDAVVTRMRADVPVAYHLSGGLDSGTVVCVAARAETRHRLATFTVRFNAPALDEGDAARRTAEHAGAGHTEIPFCDEEYVGRLAETLVRAEMIQENSHGIARLVQAEAIRAAGYKVVLAGEGGDELFAGYPQMRKDLTMTVSPDQMATARRSYAKLGAGDAPVHLRSLLRHLDFVPAWVVDRYLSVTLPMSSLLRKEFAAFTHNCDPFADLLTGETAAAQLTGRTPYHQSTYLFTKTWLCNYILAAERLDMACALEVRLPLFDHHLAEVAKWTPPAEHLNGPQAKPLLREAMRDYLPDGLYHEAKRGFFAPPAIADDRVLTWIRDLVRRPLIDDLPFFDQARVRDLVDGLIRLPAQRRAAHERVVQIIVGVLLLTERFALASD
jgi:asparagine synthase (glutamine-hydrolysing)